MFQSLYTKIETKWPFFLFALWWVPENGNPGQGLEPKADEQVAQKIDDEYEVGTEVDGQQEQVIPPDQSEQVILISFSDCSIIQSFKSWPTYHGRKSTVLCREAEFMNVPVQLQTPLSFGA